MQAVILAGGLGTRLKEVSRDIPKSMMLIGDKPLLEHQIELLRQYGNEFEYLIRPKIGQESKGNAQNLLLSS